MNRRTVFKSLLGVGAMLGLAPLASANIGHADNYDDHQCNDTCFHIAQDLARAIIEEMGDSKIGLHGWTKRKMVVTRCGNAACEITLASSSRHPYWEHRQRHLTHEEKTSFRAEYGRSHWLILCFRQGDPFAYRGFILNGRRDGWDLSINTDKKSTVNADDYTPIFQQSEERLR